MKKNVLLFLIAALTIHISLGQNPGEWVWLKGGQISNYSGDFGVQGISSPTNEPPSLYEACEWTSLDGNFWLFGGLHQGAFYSDVWKYNPITNEWTWMKGPGTLNYAGNYGIKGVPSQNNNPPCSSYGINSWVDLDGNFWMFGGGGSSAPGLFSDLWKYNLSTNEWTWMKGPGTINQPGVYGIKGVPDTANNPTCRQETAISWTDQAGDLWMFGGTGYNNPACYNDLWRFNIATNMWTWMKGSSSPDQPSIYGSKGIEDDANTPGARWAYAKWKDGNGNLWLFGGVEDWNLGHSNKTDLWRYNPLTNKWAWMGGDTTGNSIGHNGNMCIPDSINRPFNVIECRAVWKDSSDVFYGYFNGYGISNSLWKYSKVSELWTMIKADSSQTSGNGTWGTIGISSPTNIPPGLEGPIGWTDNNGHLYMFGGWCGCGLWSNALWMYTIDTTCAVTTNDIQNMSAQISSFTIIPNPNEGTFTININTQSSIYNSEIEIYNTLGEKVYSKVLTDRKEVISCKLNSGIYFIKLIEGEKHLTEKIIIE